MNQSQLISDQSKHDSGVILVPCPDCASASVCSNQAHTGRCAMCVFQCVYRTTATFAVGCHLVLLQLARISCVCSASNATVLHKYLEELQLKGHCRLLSHGCSCCHVSCYLLTGCLTVNHKALLFWDGVRALLRCRVCMNCVVCAVYSRRT